MPIYIVLLAPEEPNRSPGPACPARFILLFHLANGFVVSSVGAKRGRAVLYFPGDSPFLSVERRVSVGQ